MDLSNITIEDVPATEPREAGPNEFDPIVVSLIEAGPGKRIPLPAIPAEDVTKIKRRISGAARRHGKSPKFVQEDTKEGVVLRFRLIDKIERKTKDTDADVEDATVEA